MELEDMIKENQQGLEAKGLVQAQPQSQPQPPEQNPEQPNPEDGGKQNLSETVDRGEYEGLQTQNQQLQQRLDVVMQNMMSPEYIQFLEAKRGQGQVQNQPVANQKIETGESEKEIDFDTASQKEIVDYMVKKVSSMVESRIAPVEKTIESKTYEDTVKTYRQQISEFSQKNPDFWNYQKEMVDVANRNPKLSIDEIYYLAKAKSPKRPAPSPKPTSKPIVGGEKPKINSAPAQERRSFDMDEALKEAMIKSGLA